MIRCHFSPSPSSSAPIAESISVSMIHPPSDPSSLWRWLHLTGRLWSPVWGQGYRVLAFKDSKPRAAKRAWEGSLLPLQLIREGPKWQCKNAQEGRLLHGVKHVFMCHVKVPTEVNEAGQSPAGRASWKTAAKQEASDYITPSLKQRFSTFNAHWNHLGSS